MPDWKAFFILALALAVECLGAAHADDGHASDVPELKVLKHYLGNWKVVYESEKAAFSDGKMSAEWTLDGRFLKQTSELNANFTRPKTVRILRLVTYHQDDGVYRSWTFVSNGRTFEASGTWDADSSTMTWTSRHDDGANSKSTETFGKDGVQEWTAVSTNGEGKKIGEARGTSTRNQD